MRLYDLDKILIKLENRRLELNHLRKALTMRDGLDSPYMDGQINENAKVTEMLTELLKESMEAVRVTNVRTVPQREMRVMDGMSESVIKDRMDHDIARECSKNGYIQYEREECPEFDEIVFRAKMIVVKER